MTARIYAIANQKGGVSKSTMACVLTAGLHKAGRRVLLVDLDQQGNATLALGALPDPNNSALRVLLKDRTARECIKETAQGDIIPTGKEAGADLELTGEGAEYRLREALQEIRREYDYIIIDTPPALGILTVNALTAADGLIIPVGADLFSLSGVEDLAGTIEAVRAFSNPELKIEGILLTQYNGRSILSRDMQTTAQGIAEWLQTKLFNASIREAVAIREAQARQVSIFDHDRRAKVTKDCRAFIKELTGVEVPKK